MNWRRSIRGAVPFGASTYGTPARRRCRARDRARKVAAGVQVRDVELSRVLAQILPEAERNEALVVIGQAIREIGKHPQFDLVGRALGQPRRQPRRRGIPAASRCESSHASVVQTVTWWPRRASPPASVPTIRGMPPYAHASEE